MTNAGFVFGALLGAALGLTMPRLFLTLAVERNRTRRVVKVLATTLILGVAAGGLALQSNDVIFGFIVGAGFTTGLALPKRKHKPTS